MRGGSTLAVANFRYAGEQGKIRTKVNAMEIVRRLVFWAIGLVVAGWTIYSLWSGNRAVETEEALAHSFVWGVFFLMLYAIVRINERWERGPKPPSRKMTREEMIAGLEAILADPNVAENQKLEARARLNQVMASRPV